MENISPALLDWFYKNRRSLPFREDPTPYHVWLSEVMLQQTRVSAVLPYYYRFLEALPDIPALAACEEEKLHKLWEGLGYYSRARNLQKAAKLVTEAGAFPDTFRGLLALPGIGEYTAGAIASATFGRREAAVDGNVLRIFTRLTDDHRDITAPGVKRAVRDALQAVMPVSDADIRIFNQATMELGAMVCVPNGAPRCAVCPVRDLCLGRARGTAESLPVKRAKRERRTEEKTVFLLLRQGRVALRKRPGTGLLAGLWEFPNVEGSLDEASAGAAASAWGLTPRAWHSRLTAKHIFTHVEWHMTGYALEVAGDGPERWTWADGAGLAAHAVPSAFGRYYALATELLDSAGPRK